MAKRVVGFLFGFSMVALGLLLSACDSTGTAAGTVTDATTHNPLAGITVEVHGQDGSTTATATTDGVGRWSVPGLGVGDYTIRFADPTAAHATAWFLSQPTAATSTKVTVAGGATARADQALSAPGQVTGTISDGHGPAAGVLAVVVVRHTTDVVASAPSAADGSYAVGGLAPGTYSVGFYDPAWDPSHHTGHYPKLYDLTVPDLAQATDVVVQAGLPTAGIDGRMPGADCDPTTAKPAADLTAADLHGRQFGACDLHGAHLSGADLTGADLAGANLQGADLRGAVLTGADLTGANLAGADQTPLSITVTPGTFSPGPELAIGGVGWGADWVSVRFDTWSACTGYVPQTCGPGSLTAGPHTVIARSTYDPYKAARTSITVVPSLGLSDRTATSVTLKGAGFAGSAGLTFALDGAPISHKAAFTGGFGDVYFQTVDLPAGLAAGSHRITITDWSGNAATYTFVQYRPTLAFSTYAGAIGSPFTVRGTGWAPNGSIQVAIGGVSACTAPTDAAGSVNAPCTVPVVAGGNRAARADAFPSSATTWGFTVKPGVLGLPTAATAGGPISFTVGGYPAGSTLTASLDGSPIGTLPHSAGFASPWTVTIPGTTGGGNHVVSVTDGATPPFTWTLAVTAPAGSIDATSGPPQGWFTASTSGWQPADRPSVFIGPASACQFSALATTTVTTNCNVPHLPGGTYPVTIRNQAGTVSIAIGTFTVTGTMRADVGVPGSPLFGSGQGFTPSSPLIATLDGTALDPVGAAPRSDVNGDVDLAAFRVPTGATAGAHALVVTDGAGGHANATLWVYRPALSLTGPRTLDAPFPVAGTGFVPNQHVTLAADGNTICSAFADGAGTFSITTCSGAPSRSFTLTASSDYYPGPATLAVPVLAPSASPAVRNVSPRSTVDLRGAGFDPSAMLALTWDGQPLPTVPTVATAGDGSFSTRVAVPDDATVGVHALDVTDGSGHVAHLSWTVYRPTITLTPAHALPGATVAVALGGWPANSFVTIRIDETSCGAATDASGSGSGTCKLLSYAVAGPVAVQGRATPDDSVIAYGSDFVVDGPMVLASSRVSPGVTVPFSGSGFTPGAPVTLTFGHAFGPFVAAADGTVSGSITVPNVGAGQTYQVVLADDQGHQVTQVVRTYQPQVLGDAYGHPGDLLWLSGSGWAEGDRTVATLGSGAGSTTCSGNANRFLVGCRIPNLPPGTYTITAVAARSPYLQATITLTIS